MIIYSQPKIVQITDETLVKSSLGEQGFRFPRNSNYL